MHSPRDPVQGLVANFLIHEREEEGREFSVRRLTKDIASKIKLPASLAAEYHGLGPHAQQRIVLEMDHVIT